MLSGKQKLYSGILAGLLFTAVVPSDALANGADRLDQDRQEAADLRGQIADLDKEHQEMLNQIQALESQINEAMQKSTALEKEIADTEIKIAEQKEKLKDRVKVMYEGGDVSLWEVLFDATSFSDFVERFSLLTMIVDQDKKLVDELKANQEKLKQDQEQLKAEQADRQTKQEQLLALEKEMVGEYEALAQKLQTKEADIAAAEQEAVQLFANFQSSQSYSEPQVIQSVGGGVFAWPVPASHNVSSPFGPRWGEFHKGIDISAPVGTPIVAIESGTVVAAGPASGYGHWIIIAHGNSMSSIYGHMYANGVNVSVGQQVQRGQVIGAVGNDGRSTGPHLHLSITNSVGAYVNPMGYLQ